MSQLREIFLLKTKNADGKARPPWEMNLVGSPAAPGGEGRALLQHVRWYQSRNPGSPINDHLPVTR